MLRICYESAMNCNEKLEKPESKERQIKAIQYIQEKGMITNREYQKLCATSWDTAYRGLSKLVQKSDLIREGKINSLSDDYLMILGETIGRS